MNTSAITHNQPNRLTADADNSSLPTIVRAVAQLLARQAVHDLKIDMESPGDQERNREGAQSS
jgi:hypothetical protein